MCIRVLVYVKARAQPWLLSILHFQLGPFFFFFGQGLSLEPGAVRLCWLAGPASYIHLLTCFCLKVLGLQACITSADFFFARVLGVKLGSSHWHTEHFTY